MSSPRFAFVNSVKLAYDRVGRGFPMLLIHGSRRCSRWRTVAEDVGGAEITDSAHYVQEHQPEQVAQHILRFADAVGVIMSVA